MGADEYLQAILDREAVDTGPFSPVRGVQAVLYPVIQGWARHFLVTVHPSGSFMKGTANKSGTDIDLFISLSEQTPETLKEIHDKLFDTMKTAGLRADPPECLDQCKGQRLFRGPGSGKTPERLHHRPQPLPPQGRHLDQDERRNAHQPHTADGRQRESRILKLWRNQKKLDFPSFYLELTVIDTLSGQYGGTASGNVWKVLEYLRDRFPSARVVDPANTNNIVSDDLTVADTEQNQGRRGRSPESDQLEPDRHMTDTDWSLPRILAGLHDDIEQRLATARKAFAHPGTKGDVSESVWLALLQTYLPQRYQAASAHVVDSKGTFSDQIDVVVFDRQYSPFIFHYEGQTIVPAESVYAVFEAKQAINCRSGWLRAKESRQRQAPAPDQPAHTPCRRHISAETPARHRRRPPRLRKRLESTAWKTTVRRARRRRSRRPPGPRLHRRPWHVRLRSRGLLRHRAGRQARDGLSS